MRSNTMFCDHCNKMIAQSNMGHPIEEFTKRMLAPETPPVGYIHFDIVYMMQEEGGTAASFDFCQVDCAMEFLSHKFLSDLLEGREKFNDFLRDNEST